MTSSTFIKIENSFVRKYTPVTSSYSCQLHRKSTLTDPVEREFEIINELKGFALISPASPNVELNTTSPYLSSSNGNQSPKNVLSLIELALSEKDLISPQQQEKVKDLIKEIKEIYEERENYVSKYGLFVLDTKKSFLEPQHITQINNTEKDLLNLEQKTATLNKKMKSLQEDFINLVGKFYREKYTSSIECRTKPAVITSTYYKEIKSWNYLFPTVNLTPKVLEFYKVVKSMHHDGKNLLDSMSNINEQNAHKNLKGYVIYCETLAYYNEADGFLNYDKRLTKSILNAKVFETSKQAELFAKRRGLSASAIIEIDFVFSKVVSSQVQNTGPCLESLIARRDNQNLNEAVSPIATSSLNAPSISKKNKI